MIVRKAASLSVRLGRLAVALVSLMMVATALANKAETHVGLKNATDRSQVYRKLGSPPASSDTRTHDPHQLSGLEWAQAQRRRHQEDNSNDQDDLRTEQSSLKLAATRRASTLASNVPETTRQLVGAKPVRFHHQMPDAPRRGSEHLYDDHITQDTQQTPTETHSATSGLFRPKDSSSTERRFRRSPADGVANTLTAPALQDRQQTIHSMTGQLLVVPCRNYTLATTADLARRPTSAPASRAASKSAGPAPFQLIVPQISGISLIVWHKDEQMNSPIFAADARGVSSVRDSKQQVSLDALRGRARLELVEAQTNRILASDSMGAVQAVPALVIEDAGTQDTGLYTCTVEFHKAPTQTYQTRVAVIDPPRNMVIHDETSAGSPDARPLYSSLAGPFDEDARLLLVCRADPGKPALGQISWWQLDAVTPLSADLLRSAPPLRSKASSPHTQPLLQPLDARAKLLLTLNFDDTPDETMAATTMASLAGDIGSSDNRVADGALMQSGDLFLGALSGEFDSQQLLAQLPRALLGSDQRQRHLRHWRRVENKTSIPSSGHGKLEAHLELGQLTRSNIGDEFLCLASNEPHFGTPLNASVRLNLNLKPLSVRLESKTNGTFRLGQKAMVECHAIGSKPSASIKWFKGGRELETSPSAALQSARVPNESGEQENLISEFNRDINKLTKISYLTFVPQPGDNQQQLSCSAHNPRMPQAPTQSDSLLMDVQSAPRLALKFGTNIRSDAIHLNSDIFMDCNIEANPAISELLWLHDGQPLAPNISAGVIMSNQSLVLRHIQIEQRGVYQCLARNALGQSLSNKLELRPKFSPICDQTLTRPRYELALNQRARIECHVLAEPGEVLHFSWRFNNSAGESSGSADELSSNEHEQLAQYETNFTRSSLSFTPRSRRDFGQLLCSATNSMGRQERPCSIMLVQSELPEPLLGCFVDNQTQSSFSIHCQPAAVGATGGSSRAGQTYFILELFSNQTHSPQEANTSALQERRQRQQQSANSHLILRQPESESRNLQSEESMQDEDYSASSARGNDGADESSLDRYRVKRLLSETPSFNVANLEPDSSYNVLVYVQNSKGRSPATHHQVSTRPVAASVLASGRLELSAAKRDESAGGEPTFGAKVLNFFALGSHFRNADGSLGWASVKRPLTSIALIVLLATLCLLSLVAFTSRLLCRRGKQTTRVAPGTCGPDSMAREQNDHDSQAAALDAKRKSSSSSELRAFVGPAVRERVISGAGIKPARPLAASTSSHSTSTMSRATESKQLGGKQPLSLATNTLNVNQHGCIGSGSETSRETNTDSTFISSPQTGTESSCQSVKTFSLVQQAQQLYNNYNSMQHQRRCSRDDLNNSMQPTVYSSGSLQKAPGHFRPPVACSIVSKRPAVSQARPHNCQMARTYDQNELSCTPQISLHRGSECWSSNSPVARLDQAGAGFHGLKQGQQQGFAGGTLMQDGVYVLDAGHPISHSPGCPAVSETQTSGFWLGAALQPDRCHLVEEETGDLPLGVQQSSFSSHPMPSSMSIPISLSERLQVINSQRPNSMNTRRLSHDNLPETLLLDANAQSYATRTQTGSYLTLAASFANQHSLAGADELCATPLSIMESSTCLDLQQQLELTPPIDFANEYRHFKRAFSIENGQQEIECQVKKHRVKFETGDEEQDMAREEM